MDSSNHLTEPAQPQKKRILSAARGSAARSIRFPRSACYTPEHIAGETQNAHGYGFTGSIDVDAEAALRGMTTLRMKLAV